MNYILAASLGVGTVYAYSVAEDSLAPDEIVYSRPDAPRIERVIYTGPISLDGPTTGSVVLVLVDDDGWRFRLNAETEFVFDPTARTVKD